MSKYLPNQQYIVEQTSDEDYKNKRPYLTSSMAEALNTCPRWGIVHSVLAKRFVTKYRQMALEAGSLKHDVFSFLNLLQVGIVQGLKDHMHYHGIINFEQDRWKEIIGQGLDSEGAMPKLSDTMRIEKMIYTLIATSDFYDDPDDKNRTLDNLEYSAMELFSYWQMNLKDFDILIVDEKDATKQIGIEISLDGIIRPVDESNEGIRCIGLADAVYQNKSTKNIVLGEYKTAAMMNVSWAKAFETRHQLTLYNALLQMIFGYQEEFKTIMIGSEIPVRPTSISTRHFEVMRNQQHINQLMNTYYFSKNIIDTYKEKPLESPMFTHSCNRYFRTCSLMDLCIADKEDQQPMLDDMETAQELSPSEMKAFLQNM